MSALLYRSEDLYLPAGHEAFDKRCLMSLRFCCVMGKYLSGVKEADGEIEQCWVGWGDTTFLHFSGSCVCIRFEGLKSYITLILT